MIALEFLLALGMLVALFIIPWYLFLAAKRCLSKPHDRVMIRLVQTCWACPEQYDAYLDEKQVGYLRLRHGCFTVDYPDVNGDEIYVGYPKGDGAFEDNERPKYLNEAVYRIVKKLYPTRAPFATYRIESIKLKKE